MKRHLYKDCDRYWWRLTFKPGRFEPDPTPPGYNDRWWSYALAKQDGGRYCTVWRSEILVQDGMMPDVEDAMNDFAASATRLAIGFAKWTSTDSTPRTARDPR